jgi:ankyrin repeat protein
VTCACTAPPLERAVRAGDRATAKVLLVQGVDVDQRTDRWENTRLMRAAQQGDVAMVNLLLEHGADPNLKNYET